MREYVIRNIVVLFIAMFSVPLFTMHQLWILDSKGRKINKDLMYVACAHHLKRLEKYKVSGQRRSIQLSWRSFRVEINRAEKDLKSLVETYEQIQNETNDFFNKNCSK